MMTVDEVLKMVSDFEQIPANVALDNFFQVAYECLNLRDEINGLTGSLDRAEKALKEAQEQEPVAWLHDKEGRVDVCHDSVKKLWLKVGQQQNTQFMRGVVPCRVEHYNIPLYARPVPAVPAVAAPAVQDDCVSQDESTMMMAASALVLYRAGESAEYMAKAIEALLQSDEGCSSQDQNEVRHD